METEIATEIVPSELIRIVRLPEIAEQLIAVKEKWQRAAEEALSMTCTEDTIKAVKAKRTELRKEFDELENRRKAVKKAVLKPYDRFEAIYDSCVSDAYESADACLSGKISRVESEQKRRCEDGLRDYFAELCAVHHLDWLAYERVGIKVDMASAKAKTPTKLRRQLEEFVVGVSNSVDRINLLEDASEIMVEYQRTLDAADAICTVQERHKSIEEQKVVLDVRRAEQDREAEMVRRVEALAPPVVVEVSKPPKIRYMDFRAHGTMEQLGALKKFAADNNIKLEAIRNE